MPSSSPSSTRLPPSLTTRRLHLLPLSPTQDSHCDFIVALYNTPQFIASIGGKPTPITTRDTARAYITNRFLSEYRRNGYGTWLITTAAPATTTNTTAPPDGEGEEKKEKMVGTVSLSRGEGEQGKSCYGAPDLGFAVLPEFCGRGVATEAGRGVVEWFCREKEGGGVVLGLFDPRNEASRAVFRKLGFGFRGKRKLEAFGGTVGEVWVWPGELGEEGVRGVGLPAVEEE